MWFFPQGNIFILIEQHIKAFSAKQVVLFDENSRPIFELLGKQESSSEALKVHRCEAMTDPYND